MLREIKKTKYLENIWCWWIWKTQNCWNVSSGHIDLQAEHNPNKSHIRLFCRNWNLFKNEYGHAKNLGEPKKFENGGESWRSHTILFDWLITISWLCGDYAGICLYQNSSSCALNIKFT